MTDKALLELAAKAAGYELLWGGTYKVGDDVVDCTDLPYTVSNQPDVACAYWNPLEDDGDALRLAVKLKMEFHFEEQSQQECIEVLHSFEDHKYKAQCVLQDLGTDPYAATRRAIVRAAAEIGKTVAEKSA